MNLNIKQVKYETDEYDSSCLTLDISGNGAHHSIINSLRKVCLDQIPIYALDRSKIKILRNSSVYDNTEMEVRFSQLPLKRIDSNVTFLPLKYGHSLSNNLIYRTALRMGTIEEGMSCLLYALTYQ